MSASQGREAAEAVVSLLAVDHVSFTVADIERSRDFYGLFGFMPLKRYISAGPKVDQAAGIERADMDICWLEHPTAGLRLELIRYIHHEAGRANHNSRVGAAHLCMSVADMDAAYGALKQRGFEMASEPNIDEFGVRWVYSRDPDGNAVEIVQNPD
jgi:catechol 2,3-dioxygenase-like lactoylglutathione lyase family enzyme